MLVLAEALVLAVQYMGVQTLPQLTIMKAQLIMMGAVIITVHHEVHSVHHRHLLKVVPIA